MLAASQPLTQFEIPRRRLAGGGKLLFQRVVHVVIRENLGGIAQTATEYKRFKCGFLGEFAQMSSPSASIMPWAPLANRFTGAHFSCHLPDANALRNFAKPCDRKTFSYRSLGVRPVFLARTFMAVGPRVTPLRGSTRWPGRTLRLPEPSAFPHHATLHFHVPTTLRLTARNVLCRIARQCA